jgi:hypothetical protein
MKTLTTAAEMAKAAPKTRNRYVDFLRVMSLLVVIVGHWLMAVITIDSAGDIQGDNILGLVPWMQYLTWTLQVMPVFFIVGGFANAASWTSAQEKGVTYADWVRSRMSRLLRPTLVFAAVWTVLTLVFAHVVRLSPETLEVGTMLVAVPVWFLGVYLLVIPLVPVMLRLHERLSVVVPLLLIATAAVVDVLVRDFGLVGIGYVNYLFVWVAVHQLGFFWREGRITGPLRAGLLAITGLAALIILSSVGPYSRSMLGVPGEEFGNTQPPTIMLMAVGLFQFGIVLALEPALRKWLERERVWAAVISANGLAMTVYLWHLPAMAFGVLIAMVSGVGLRGDPLTAGWWATRPVWVAGLALITVPLVVVFSRLERTGAGRALSAGRPVAAVAGSAAAAVGLGLLALDGFYNPDAPFALAITPLALLMLGAMLLGQLKPLIPARR